MLVNICEWAFCTNTPRGFWAFLTKKTPANPSSPLSYNYTVMRRKERIMSKPQPSMDQWLAEAKASNELYLIEVKGAIGCRANLGRPTTTAMENKEAFMAELG